MPDMVTCTRRLTFEAGHRVYGHESRCAHPHGHSWKVWVTASAASLDSIGRVIDFSVLKEKIGGWIDTHWDHAFLVAREDTAMQAALSLFSRFPTSPASPRVFVLPMNPTSEHLALYLLQDVCPQVLADTMIQVVKVIVQETENCTAEALYENLRG